MNDYTVSQSLLGLPTIVWLYQHKSRTFSFLT